MARPCTCGARGRSRGARRPCGRGRDGRRGGGRARRRTGAFACRGTSRASTARSASLASSLARKVARGVALGKRPAPRRPPPRARALGLQLVGARGHALLGDTARGDTARGDMERTAREKKRRGIRRAERRADGARWGGGRTRVGASERRDQDHVRVRACALARTSKGKERRGEERGEHYFVCDEEDDGNGGALMWRVAFHEFAHTRRTRSRDRKRALMARAHRRTRVEHNRQLPWLLPWQQPLPLPCRRRHCDTSAPPSQLPRPAAADADRGGTSPRASRRRRTRRSGNGNNSVDTAHGACQTNKKITPKHRSHRGGS